MNPKPEIVEAVEKQRALWRRESEAVDAERVQEIVTREMSSQEAEDAAAKLFGLSVPAAIYLIERAVTCGVIDGSFGRVRPRSFSASFRRRCALLLERGTKPECPEVLPLVRGYYAQFGNGAGGSLHVVLDDQNVDDCFVDGAIGRALSVGDIDGMALAAVLRTMSKTQRLKLATDPRVHSQIGPCAVCGEDAEHRIHEMHFCGKEMPSGRRGHAWVAPGSFSGKDSGL